MGGGESGTGGGTGAAPGIRQRPPHGGRNGCVGDARSCAVALALRRRSEFAETSPDRDRRGHARRVQRAPSPWPGGGGSWAPDGHSLSRRSGAAAATVSRLYTADRAGGSTPTRFSGGCVDSHPEAPLPRRLIEDFEDATDQPAPARR